MLKCRLEELIKESGYKKNFIAKQLNVSPQTVSSWIHNKNYIPMDKAFKIADLLKCKVDDLYERVEGKK